MAICMLLFLALVTTVAAGRDRPKPTCNSCTIKVRDCKKNCLNNHHNDKAFELACQVACKCHVGKMNKFCRESCDLQACEGELGGADLAWVGA